MRNVVNLLAMIAATASLCVGATGGPARAQDAPAGNAAEGRRIYLADGCFTCHGRSGQGGALNGPAPILARTAMPWEGFVEQLRHPMNEMPAYAETVMSDKQIADIYAFLQSLPGPLPAAKDMAIFKD
jgi:mono/diheme cytochrome c family protein